MKREAMSNEAFEAIRAKIGDNGHLGITDSAALCEEIDRLRSLLATPAAPQGQVEVLVGALRLCRDAMDMQLKRQSGEFHLSAPAARAIWDEAMVAADAALAGVPQGERRGDAGSIPPLQPPEQSGGAK